MATLQPCRETLSAIVEWIWELRNSVNLPRKIWWAIWLSSKNPFASPLVEIAGKACQGRLSPPLKGKRWETKPLAEAKAWAKFLIQTCLEITYARWSLRHRLRVFREIATSKKVYVLRTFSVPSDFSNNHFSDRYFSDLRVHLEKSGLVQVLTVTLPIQGNGFTLVRRCRNQFGVFPFHSWLRVTDVFSVIFETIRALFSAHVRPVTLQGLDLTDELRTQLNRDLLSSSTLTHLLMYRAFRRLALEFMPVTCAYTFENHPIEKLMILALREYSPSTYLIGYHHVSAAPGQANLFLATTEAKDAPLPDLILTVGKRDTDLLRRLGNYGKIQIETACAFRYSYIHELTPREKSPERPTLLIALDGVPQAVDMLEYAAEQLAKCSGWTFVFREHAAMKIKDLEYVNDCKTAIPPCAVISRRSTVLQDLEEATAVLYFGSTVAIEAMALGVPMIQYRGRQVLSHDVIEHESTLKWQVGPDDPLFPILEEIRLIPEEKVRSLKQETRRSVESYLAPVTSAGMTRFTISGEHPALEG